MKYTNETMTGFYRQLGKVFYAVAAADKVIQKEELNTLAEVVKSEWLPFDSTFDEFGTDSAYQIEIVFDWLRDNSWDVQSAITGLRDFKKVHPSLFTKPVADLIMKTADAIASSFSGKSNAELLVINQLERVLME